MSFARRIVVLLALLGFCPAALLAQGNGVLGQDTTDTQGYRVLAGKVVNLHGDPVAHATVMIYPLTPFRLYETDNRGEFQAEYEFINTHSGMDDFSVTVKVSKKGFQDAHKLTVMGVEGKFEAMLITLRQPQNDPMLLSQSDLIQDIGSRLRQLGPEDGLSAKQEKNYAHGVQEFLDRNHLDRAVQDFAKVVKANPSCLRCRTMLAMAELKWGDWDDANRELGDSVNAIIKDSKLGRPEPLLAYGTLVSWQHDPDKAASSYILEATKYAPRDALTLQELGRAQCFDFDWEAANQTLKKALDAGAGQEARWLRAEALLWAGTAQEAQDELNRYLDGQETKKMSPLVRSLADRIEEKRKDAKVYVAAYAKLQARGEDPIDYLSHPPKQIANLEPAADQSSLNSIMASVGNNIEELYKNLPNTSSVENIHQEALDKKGKVGLVHDQKFRYLCLMPTQLRGPSVDEYRADPTGTLATPTGLMENLMLTSGFVGAALIFHPLYQQGSTFRYWGREKVKGASTYVIAFAQQPAKARICGSFHVGATSRLVYFQGLAWVDVESFQIVRLVSDLLTPLPQVKLDKETTEIDFNEVQFNSVKRKFWLPGQVTVTLDWDGRTLRNKHQYSDFLVFNVQQSSRTGMPKQASQASHNIQP